MSTLWDAYFYLENGHLYEGAGLGSATSLGGEAVFNTGMTGYQEIFTDPSYSNQVVVMTSSHIGNTGINFEDHESKSVYLGGVVMRDYVHVPSNWRSKLTLHDFLVQHKIPAISDVDTREITTLLRDEGAQRSVIFPRKILNGKDPIDVGKELINTVPEMEGLDLVSKVSTKDLYVHHQGTGVGHIVVYDFGVKTNILRSFSDKGFKVSVVPYNFPFEEVQKLNPLGIVLSNGPGDPALVPGSVQEIQKFVGKIPTLAICMGHQLLARSLGANTFKLKFGHHGINHPVMDNVTGRISITSQNHGFSVSADELKKNKDIIISHYSLNDDSVEGFQSKKMRFYSVQFHPEAKPGPNDASYIFEQFIRGFLQ